MPLFDAPETDDSVPDRTREQRRYFGVTPKELHRAGEEAKAFVPRALKQPVTIRTPSQAALGRTQRHYAVVTVGGEALAEMLVSRGLARAKGALANLPDGRRAKQQLLKLQRLQAEAKVQRLGIWAASNKTPRWQERLIGWCPRSGRQFSKAVGKLRGKVAL